MNCSPREYRERSLHNIHNTHNTFSIEFLDPHVAAYAFTFG